MVAFDWFFRFILFYTDHIVTSRLLFYFIKSLYVFALDLFLNLTAEWYSLYYLLLLFFLDL